jgi:DNA-binding Lrp family transcriptional regulator
MPPPYPPHFHSRVRRIFLVSGRHDVIVHVMVKDIDHLRNLGFDHFARQSVVVSIQAAFVFESRARNEPPLLWEKAQSRGDGAGSRRGRQRLSRKSSFGRKN